jgi:hypothetical protein
MAIGFNSFAQITSTIHPGIYYTEHDILPLYNSDSLIGYAEINMTKEESSKNNYSYSVDILDLNLNKIHSYEIIKEKKCVFEHAAYNESAVCLISVNKTHSLGITSSINLDYDFYDLTLKSNKTLSREISHDFEFIFDMGRFVYSYQIINPIVKKGFVLNSMSEKPSKSQNSEMLIEFYDNFGNLTNEIKEETFFKSVGDYCFTGKIISQFTTDIEKSAEFNVIYERKILAYKFGEKESSFEILLDSADYAKVPIDVFLNPKDSSFTLFTALSNWGTYQASVKKLKKYNGIKTQVELAKYGIWKFDNNGVLKEKKELSANLNLPDISIKASKDYKEKEEIVIRKIRPIGENYNINAEFYSVPKKTFSFIFIELDSNLNCKKHTLESQTSGSENCCYAIEFPIGMSLFGGYTIPFKNLSSPPFINGSATNYGSPDNTSQSYKYTDILNPYRGEIYSTKNSLLVYFEQSENNTNGHYIFSISLFGIKDDNYFYKKRDFDLKGGYYKILPAKAGYIGLFLYNDKDKTRSFGLEKID